MNRFIANALLFFLVAGLASAASVTVTKPAAGEIWYKGSPYTITWTKDGTLADTVRITLRNAATLDEVKLIQGGAANTGTYSPWTIPADVADGQYVVRVKVTGMTISDDSDAFTIGSAPAGPIAVKIPRINEVWYFYSTNTHGVVWSTTGNVPSPYTISLMSADGKTVVATLPGTVICCSLSSNWPAATDAPPGSYRIRVKAAGSEIFGLSEVFSLSPDYVRITFPGTNKGVQETKNCTISWDRMGNLAGSVEIRLFNESSQLKKIVTASAPNSGSYIWTVPGDVPTGKYYLYIHVLGTQIDNRSDLFNVSLPILNPTVIKK